MKHRAAGETPPPTAPEREPVSVGKPLRDFSLQYGSVFLDLRKDKLFTADAKLRATLAGAPVEWVE